MLLTKYISPIVIIGFYFAGFSITSGIEYLTKIDFSKILTSQPIRVAVDSAIATLVFNFISYILNSPGSISVELTSRRYSSPLIIGSNGKAKIQFTSKIDYKYKKLKKVIEWLGGFYIVILHSDWVSIGVDKASEYGKRINYENPSEEIIVYCNDFLSKKQLKGRIDLDLVLQCQVTVELQGVITTELKLGNDKGVKHYIAKWLIAMFFDDSFAQLELLSQKKDE